MARKYQSLDIVKMYSTLTRDHWITTLRLAMARGNMEKLLSWRYGMQSGLSDAASKGLTTPELDHWVIKRIKNIEDAMRMVVRKRHPMPTDDPKHDPVGYKVKCLMAKKARDREFREWLMHKNF